MRTLRAAAQAGGHPQAGRGERIWGYICTVERLGCRRRTGSARAASSKHRILWPRDTDRVGPPSAQDGDGSIERRPAPRLRASRRVTSLSREPTTWCRAVSAPPDPPSSSDDGGSAYPRQRQCIIRRPPRRADYRTSPQSARLRSTYGLPNDTSPGARSPDALLRATDPSGRRAQTHHTGAFSATAKILF